MIELPKAGDGFSAEVKASGQRLKLVAIETGYGAVANIYTFTQMKWIGPPHYCSNLRVARRWAEWEMREYFRSILGKPPGVRIKWTSLNSPGLRPTASPEEPFVAGKAAMDPKRSEKRI
jgi:hypothetical protein